MCSVMSLITGKNEGHAAWFEKFSPGCDDNAASFTLICDALYMLLDL
jgi:hypothetical protein